MPLLSIGDLSNSYFLQLRGTALKADQNRLTQELASGQISDVKTRLAGNVSYFSSIERDMKALTAYKVATTEATQFTGAVQDALGRVQTSTNDLSTAILRASSGAVQTVVSQVSADAASELTNIMSALNGDIAGRSLFAGAATNVAPLQSGDVLMAQLRNAISGAGTVDDIVAAAQAWFDDPAGFDNAVYMGADTNMPPFRLNEDTSLSQSVRADNDAIKAVLMNTALAALATDPVMHLDEAAQRDLLSKAGEGLLVAQDQVTGLRGNVGFIEQRIENAASRNAAEVTSLEFAKGAFLEADPYETATNLENVQFQLQSLYTITVRMSELSLGNYLR